MATRPTATSICLAGGEYYNFTGFETLEAMNTECIDGYQGMYAVESNVSEG